VDVSGLDLDSIVEFDRDPQTKTCSVEVYGDKYMNNRNNKLPASGEKLNRPAIIALQCWPVDYNPDMADVDVMRRKLDKYEARLRSSTEEMGAEFIEYDKQQGIWIFAVPQFV